MGLFKNLKNGLRSTKWVASKNGRQYLKDQKIDRKGIRQATEHHEGKTAIEGDKQ